MNSCHRLKARQCPRRYPRPSGHYRRCREGNFTHAAAQRDVSQSALSHRIRDFEERLGVRLLNRATRSVAPTEADARLLADITPRLEAVTSALNALADMRDASVGLIQLSVSAHAAETVLWPVLPTFLAQYPDIQMELAVDHGLWTS
ncbi:MAG: LysR family transcriptional regulator [Paracoccus sp. (in: a-proteobacteria)]|uniref:LysR family transcriptional regulator n=1 Tax=Paracoccus sp. TaxID=267 RepID=UPI0026DFF9E8|nr:LysR family transcriptional regulator [Paracoccus sp. (in: a-proteobacteria)]MDO5632893.1 LysR family transcriptional regulator [Paracoccus sp. (in: a-proteobacteria)]